MEAVLGETERFHNDKDIGRVAIALAKRCFFGEEALQAVTVYGRAGKQKLSSQKLKQLKAALERTLPFQNKTAIEAESLWKSCLKAIASTCKALRVKDKANN